MNEGLDPSVHPSVRALILRELEEDTGTGDATSLALVPESAIASGRIFSKGSYIAAGIPIGLLAFELADPGIETQATAADGDQLAYGDTMITFKGPVRAILTAERTVLNLMQRMTGIATLTQAYVKAADNANTALLDTRKTTPGLRMLEKYSVRCGGGTNHRMGLYDRIMIKDNHLAYWRQGSDGQTIAEAVAAARKAYPDLEVEVEVDTLDQLVDALQGNPDWVLLDNMPPEELKNCVALCKGRTQTEASGGITLDTIADVAATGVDAISVGALTHSAIAADLSLELSEP